MHPVPDSALNPVAVIIGLAVQLSVAVADPTSGYEAGLQPMFEEAGQDVITGAVASSILLVAPDAAHIASELAVAEAIEPHAEDVTYLVLILYPEQLSAVGGVFAPHVDPLSKLYSILKPETDAGGVTMIAPHTALTVGAAGALGKTTTSIVLLSPQGELPVVPAAMLPQAEASA